MKTNQRTSNRAKGLRRWGALAVACGLIPVARAEQTTTAAPTYYKDALPILQERCARCHRAGEVAPMALDKFEGLRPWVKSIKRAVSERSMPPWFADPAHGEFSNEDRLSEQEIATLAAWVDAGAQAGDPADAPPAKVFTPGWNIGQPDQVFTMAEFCSLPAEGQDEYNYFTIDLGLTEDKYVTAVEIRPGDPTVVHHVIAFVQEPGKPARFSSPEGGGDGRQSGAVKSNSFRPESPEKLAQIMDSQKRRIENQAKSPRRPRNPVDMPILGGMAPGMPPWIGGPGEGRLLKAGSKLVLQIHYHMSGEAAMDKTSVGVKYASAPTPRLRRTSSVPNMSFAIPPGDADFVVKSEQTFAKEITIASFMPHMHLRGKAFEYKVIYPDGKEEILLSVPKYDFNWQLTYELKNPISLPKGTTMVCTAHFDNSAQNAANPDPEAIVRFGEPTSDEMMIGWFDYYVDSEAFGVEG